MATGPKAANQTAGARAGTGSDDLTADIQQLRDDIARLAEDLRKTGTRSMSRARQVAKDGADQLRGSAEEWQDDLTEAVREKPLTALALAMGAGWLLGMIMRR